MTQSEVKREIEYTRDILNHAIETQSGFGKILDISRVLDSLIEEYLKLSVCGSARQADR